MQILTDIIKDQLNVKEVNIISDHNEIASIVSTIIKPNFKTLGKRAGNKMGAIKKTIDSWGEEELTKLKHGESIILNDVEITLEDIIVEIKLLKDNIDGMFYATDGEIVVGLNTNLTPELIAEGHANEIAFVINDIRKNKDCEVNDFINVYWYSDHNDIKSIIDTWKDMIFERCKTKSIDTKKLDKSEYNTFNINGMEMLIEIEKLDE